MAVMTSKKQKEDFVAQVLLTKITNVMGREFAIAQQENAMVKPDHSPKHQPTSPTKHAQTQIARTGTFLETIIAMESVSAKQMENAGTFLPPETL